MLSEAVDRLNGFHAAAEEDCSDLCTRLDAANRQLHNNSDPMEREAVIAMFQEQHAVMTNALQETMERLEAECKEVRSAVELLHSNAVALQDTLSNVVTQLNGAKEDKRLELRALLTLWASNSITIWIRRIPEK